LNELGFFDRFASSVARFVAKAPFFAFCVILVLVWAPSFFLLQSVDTWQLIINTVTTIITFLLVALLQNTQDRDMRAIHQKLNALAEGVADLMEEHPGMDADMRQLREAVGLEERTGT
jgi:low affinity Fe/Cu permease